MNEALKQKRDELAKQFQADDDMYPKSGPANSFRTDSMQPSRP